MVLPQLREWLLAAAAGHLQRAQLAAALLVQWVLQRLHTAASLSERAAAVCLLLVQRARLAAAVR